VPEGSKRPGRGPIRQRILRLRRWLHEIERSSAKRPDEHRRRFRTAVQLAMIPPALIVVVVVGSMVEETEITTVVAGRAWVDTTGTTRAIVMESAARTIEPWPDGQPLGTFHVTRREVRSGWPAVIRTTGHPPAIDLSGSPLRAVPEDPIGGVILAALDAAGRAELAREARDGEPQGRWRPDGLLLGTALFVMVGWILAAVAEPMVAVAARRWHNARVRRRKAMVARGICPTCGYDLTGSLWSERCPECGEEAW